MNDKPYKIIFSKTGKPKELRQHAKKVMKKNQTKISIPEVMVKITSFSKSVNSLKSHMDYVSRNGAVDVFDSMDNKINSIEEKETKSLHELAESIGTNDKSKRLSCNMILSMPPGTPVPEFEESVRAFLSENFSNHEYTYVFHDDTDAYHSHISIPMKSIDGKRLNPRKDDIARWRESFADCLEERGILANAMTAPAKGIQTHRRDEVNYKQSKVVDFGKAKFEFEDNNKTSYFVTVQDQKGNEKTFWGEDLERVINEKGIEKDDYALFEVVDTQTVGNGWTKNKWDATVLTEKKELDLERDDLKEESLNNVVSAWKKIQSDLIRFGDIDTAKLITQFCQDHLKKYLPINKTKEIEDEKTR